MADDLISVATGIALRPVVEADRAFLMGLYGSTRDEELSHVSWGPDELASFIAMQFEAQDVAYRQTFPGARFLVVLVDGERVGRLTVARLESEVRLVDIALVPAARGRGIGTALVTWVVTTADRDGLPATLHVDPASRAMGLYARLGFEPVEQHGIIVFMRRAPQRQLKTAS